MASDSTATQRSMIDNQTKPHTRAATTSLGSKLLLIAQVEREGEGGGHGGDRRCLHVTGQKQASSSNNNNLGRERRPWQHQHQDKIIKLRPDLSAQINPIYRSFAWKLGGQSSIPNLLIISKF